MRKRRQAACSQTTAGAITPPTSLRLPRLAPQSSIKLHVCRIWGSFLIECIMSLSKQTGERMSAAMALATISKQQLQWYSMSSSLATSSSAATSKSPCSFSLGPTTTPPAMWLLSTVTITTFRSFSLRQARRKTASTNGRHFSRTPAGCVANRLSRMSHRKKAYFSQLKNSCMNWRVLQARGETSFGDEKRAGYGKGCSQELERISNLMMSLTSSRQKKAERGALTGLPLERLAKMSHPTQQDSSDSRALSSLRFAVLLSEIRDPLMAGKCCSMNLSPTSQPNSDCDATASQQICLIKLLMLCLMSILSFTSSPQHVRAKERNRRLRMLEGSSLMELMSAFAMPGEAFCMKARVSDCRTMPCSMCFTRIVLASSSSWLSYCWVELIRTASGSAICSLLIVSRSSTPKISYLVAFRPIQRPQTCWLKSNRINADNFPQLPTFFKCNCSHSFQKTQKHLLIKEVKGKSKLSKSIMFFLAKAMHSRIKTTSIAVGEGSSPSPQCHNCFGHPCNLDSTSFRSVAVQNRFAFEPARQLFLASKHNRVQSVSTLIVSDCPSMSLLRFCSRKCRMWSYMVFSMMIQLRLRNLRPSNARRCSSCISLAWAPKATSLKNLMKFDKNRRLTPPNGTTSCSTATACANVNQRLCRKVAASRLAFFSKPWLCRKFISPVSARILLLKRRISTKWEAVRVRLAVKELVLLSTSRKKARCCWRE